MTRFKPRRFDQPLLRDHLTGTAELGWEILQLGEAIPHGQHGLSVCL